MRPRLVPCASVLLLSACGGDEPVLSGTLIPDAGASEVWVVGGPERALIEGDSFRIEGVAGDTLELRFAHEGEEVAALLLTGGREAAGLRLEEIWFDDGRAFPTRVVAEGAPVLINGIRYAGAATVPEALDVHATVLAVGGDGEALLLRPQDASLPDLRVVVTPGTRVRSPDGEPAELDELGFGDSLRVVGGRQADYLVATEVVVPRRVAGGRVGADRGSDRGGASGGDGEASEARREAEPPGRGRENRGRGRGRGQGRG